MRSDFYALPYAARQVIRRGERAAAEHQQRARTIAELQDRVDDLEKALAAANETIIALRFPPHQEDKVNE